MPIKAGWLITKIIIIHKSSTGQAPVLNGEYDYDYNYGQESHLRNIVILPHSTLMGPVKKRTGPHVHDDAIYKGCSAQMGPKTR